MNRTALARQVSDALGLRQVVWFGTRGDDIESVADLPQLSAAVSLISAYSRRSLVESFALEDLSGVRIDLDTFDIDTVPNEESVVALRRKLLGVLSRPSTLFAYRASTFLSAICFARLDRCQYLGLFSGQQTAFEHKPWVECSLAAIGIPSIPWTYVADDDQLDALRFLDEAPIVLRRSRTTGGVGLVRLDDPNQLELLWPNEDEAFVSVAPFISGLPINVGAVVWRDGVTVHPASIQLIGVAGCTERPFGYCGNDFGAIDDLDHSEVEVIEHRTLAIGEWLRNKGFLGAFGVDFLLKDGEPLFTEINPRFQGSTHVSCQLTTECDESGLLLEHLAAHLGFEAPPSRRLTDFTGSDNLAHFVVHAVHNDPPKIDPSAFQAAAMEYPETSRVDVVTRPDLRTERGAAIARITTRCRLTTTGFDLTEPWASMVDRHRYAADSDLITDRGTSGGSPFATRPGPASGS